MMADFFRKRNGWRPDEIAFKREARWTALGLAWSVISTIEVNDIGFRAHVMVLPNVAHPRARTPTSCRNEVYLMFDRLLEAMTRLGYHGEWRQERHFSGPSADFSKTLRTRTDIERECEALTRLKMETLLRSCSAARMPWCRVQ